VLKLTIVSDRDRIRILLFVIARSTCDEAIQLARVAMDCFAALAMTA
jgi:hypothetical protein